MAEEKPPKSHAKVQIMLRITEMQAEAIDLAIKLGIAKDRVEFVRDAVKEKLNQSGIWSQLIYGQLQHVPKGTWNILATMDSGGLEQALSDPKTRAYILKRIEELEKEKETED